MIDCSVTMLINEGEEMRRIRVKAVDSKYGREVEARGPDLGSFFLTGHIQFFIL